MSRQHVHHEQRAAAGEVTRARHAEARSRGSGAARPLVVTGVDDRAEQAAEAIAARVFGDVPPAARTASPVRRTPAPHAGQGSAVGREGGPVGRALEREIAAARTGGSPLPTGLRRQMEPALGQDLGHVRLHVGSSADRLTQDLGARAFTLGRDVFVRGRDFAPGSRAGQRLLAHEVAHTLQPQVAGGDTVARVLDGSSDAGATKVPTRKEWKKTSRLKRKPRSTALKAVDDAVKQYERLTTEDPETEVAALEQILLQIRDWRGVKRRQQQAKGGSIPGGAPDADSARRGAVADLSNTVQGRLTELLLETLSQFEDAAPGDDHADYRARLEKLRVRIDRARDLGLNDARTRTLFAEHGARLQASQDAEAEELAPLSAEFLQAVLDRDVQGVQRAGSDLRSRSVALFVKTSQDVLKSVDGQDWATAFFHAPPTAYGADPYTAPSLLLVTDWSWLTTALADAAVDNVVVPNATSNKQMVVQVLQHAPFRQALLAKASADRQAVLRAMPLVRMSENAEGAAAASGNQPTFQELADAVFDAFLGDQPSSGLTYATNAAGFDSARFLLAQKDAITRGPCMMLSNVLTDVFKAVLPPGHPAMQANKQQPGALVRKDIRPMLTKPLAKISQGKGILTRDQVFKGNVARYGTTKGYDKVNRIFFGDGHEWLKVGDKEYDPTLGVSGPEGTIKNLVEATTFTPDNEAPAVTTKAVTAADLEEFNLNQTWTGSDGTRVVKSTAVPPGGAALLFERSVIITEAGR